MAKNEMAAGAEHVLAHGTARTRAAAGKQEAGGKEAAAGDGEKKIHHIEVHADTKGPGRHMVHKHHPPHEKPEHDETYSVGDQAAMHAHLDEHLPEGGAAEEAGEGAQEQPAEGQMAAAEHGGEAGGA